MTTWTGLAGDLDWNTAGNWDAGVPNAATNAVLTGSQDIFRDGVCACKNFDSTAFTGTLSGSALYVNGAMALGATDALANIPVISPASGIFFDAGDITISSLGGKVATYEAMGRNVTLLSDLRCIGGFGAYTGATINQGIFDIIIDAGGALSVNGAFGVATGGINSENNWTWARDAKIIIGAGGTIYGDSAELTSPRLPRIETVGAITLAEGNIVCERFTAGGAQTLNGYTITQYNEATEFGENIAPVGMTSDAGPGGVTTGPADATVWKMFDADDATFAYGQGAKPYNFVLHLPEARVLRKMRFLTYVSTGYAPREFTIDTSEDGVSWDTHLSVKGAPDEVSTWEEYEIGNPYTAREWVRMRMTVGSLTGPSELALRSMELFEAAGGGAGGDAEEDASGFFGLM